MISGKSKNLRFLAGYGMESHRHLPRARDFEHLLNHLVKKLRLDRVGGAVIDLFALSAGDNQPRRAQRPQMVRQRGRGHLHALGKLNNAFLTVAENKEQTHARRIAQILESCAAA